jgi:hypothetical protein
MPVSGSLLLLYAGAHKISLKYLFPEKMFIEICCQKCQKRNTICAKKLGIEGEFSNAQMIIYFRRH